MCYCGNQTTCNSCETDLCLDCPHGKCPKCTSYICAGCRDNAPFKCGCGFESDRAI